VLLGRLRPPLPATHRMGVADHRLHANQRSQKASVVMGEVIQLRPLVLGYARLAPFAGHGHHTTVQAQLSSYALGPGYNSARSTSSAPVRFPCSITPTLLPLT
jgi:hypothetical protein